MNRMATLAIVASLVLGQAAAATAEVKVSGDANVWVNDWNGQKYGKSVNSTTVSERYRMRTDFIASEDVKFRLGVRVNNNSQIKGLENISR